ncbi:uncharacterized protein C8Q71DRAFT_727765 [Rhodofomes roseus]|uniref:Uncharacterized protein n=1 Tax=Rhodofomes roseus TaxID=34475 RepID=A0ABQ8K057_9APHY|nr:uncharacterized protein C8Q71DRAFT_727765 [Rhodofomes roseus]KAH9830006.1 hypothetical protein C8Q71DRAFT_727765 [Rhodofomes roseus]
MTHNQTSLTAVTALQFAQSAAIITAGKPGCSNSENPYEHRSRLGTFTDSEYSCSEAEHACFRRTCYEHEKCRSIFGHFRSPKNLVCPRCMGKPGTVPLAARSFTSASPSLGKIPAPAPGVANKEVIKGTPASTSEASTSEAKGSNTTKTATETTQKRKASNAGTVSTPAKKTKSKGKAAASVAADKGKGKAVENEGKGQDTASAIAITDSDYEVSSSHSSDNEYDVAEQLMESSDEDTPLLNFQTLPLLQAPLPGKHSRKHHPGHPSPGQEVTGQVLADLRIKHAAELQKACMEPAITATNQAKAIKDYYAGSSTARKVGEEIPALEFAAPASALPDTDTLLGKMGPNTLGAIDQNSTQLAPYVSNAQLGHQAQSGPSTSRKANGHSPLPSVTLQGYVATSIALVLAALVLAALVLAAQKYVLCKCYGLALLALMVGFGEGDGCGFGDG